MGNQVSVDSILPTFDSVISLSYTASTKKTNFRSNIKAWVVKSGNEIFSTLVTPVDINSVQSIDNTACYVVLHIYKNIPATSQTTLSGAFEDMEDNLTPRGLEHRFAHGENSTMCYDVYLWHGAESSPITRAFAISRAIELENKLEEKNIVEKLFEIGSPINITATDNQVSSKNNHLYRSLCGERSPQDAAMRLLLGLDQESAKDETCIRLISPSDKPEPSPRVVRIIPGGFKLQMPINRTEADNDSASNSSASGSSRSSFRISLESVERTFGEEATTPRRERSNEEHIALDVREDERPMSGNALLQIHRKVCSKVNDYLFLGGNYIARDKDVLQKNGITHIVNAALTVCECYFSKDFQYLPMSLYDAGTESVIGVFFSVIDFIEKARAQNGKIYIHCFEGVSRSATMTLAYLMWKNRTPFDKTLEEVKMRRPVTSPNSGFIVQLIQWEKMLANPSYHLYRISALNDMYDEHGEIMAKLCTGRTLDSRTCFILHAAPVDRIYVWLGSCIILESLQTEAQRFATLLQKYLSSENTIIITLTEQEAVDHTEFQDALAQVPIEKNFNQNEPYPDIKNLLKKSARKPIVPVVQVVEADNDLFEVKEGHLFEYPSLEQLTSFDVDDLDSEKIYILQPVDKKLIYVWVGSEAMEERKETLEYIGEDVGKVFISKKMLGGGTKIIIVEQDNEPDEFFDYFN